MNDTLDTGVRAFCVVGIGPNHEFVNFFILKNFYYLTTKND